MFSTQLLERCSIGRVARLCLLLRCEFEPFEQNLAELLGRVHIELLPRIGPNQGPQPLDFACEMVAKSLKFDDVDPHTHRFHASKNRHERHFDRVIELDEALGLHRGARRIYQPVDAERSASSVTEVLTASPPKSS